MKKLLVLLLPLALLAACLAVVLAGIFLLVKRRRYGY